MEEKEDSHQREIDGISEKGEQQTLCQFAPAFSEQDDTEQLDGFVKADAKQPDSGTEAGHDCGKGKDGGKEYLQDKISRGDRVTAVSAFPTA